MAKKPPKREMPGGEKSTTKLDLMGGYLHTVTVDFWDKDALTRHMEVLLSFIKSRDQPLPDVEKAAEYLGLGAYIERFHPDSYGWAGEETTMAAAPGNDLRREITNPTVKPDIYDGLRDLDRAMKALSRHIRMINDQDGVAPEIKAVRAYLDSAVAFLDMDKGEAPPTIPTALPAGILDRLAKVDWFKVSDTAQKLAETIMKGIQMFF